MFDCREYERAAHFLKESTSPQAVFLRNYSLFLAGEKKKTEETLESGVHPGVEPQNKYLEAIKSELQSLRQNKTADGFHLYL